MIRRFIVVYLVLVPFGLVEGAGWATPLVTVLIAYPILALDHIGTELQNPFGANSLGRLPLDEICANVEGDVMTLVERRAADRETPAPEAEAAAPH